MKYYQVVADAGATLAGKFHLTDAQHAARRHIFGAKSAKDNRYATPAKAETDERAAPAVTAHFKKGEVFGFDGAIPKGFTGLEPWQGNFDDRIKGEREAAAARRAQDLAQRNPPPKKDGKGGGLFGARA